MRARGFVCWKGWVSMPTPRGRGEENSVAAWVRLSGVTDSGVAMVKEHSKRIKEVDRQSENCLPCSLVSSSRAWNRLRTETSFSRRIRYVSPRGRLALAPARP